MRLFLLILWGVLLQTSSVDALVTARFSASELRPLTGEPFTLELIVSLPPQTELAELPTFSDPWGDFEVREIGEVLPETLDDGTIVYRQALTVVLWRPRDYVTPDTFIGYRLTGFNDVQRVPVRAEQFTVATVVNPEDATLRPFKPLIDLPYTPPWVVVVGGAVVMALSVYSYLAYRQWRAEQANKPQVVPTLSAEDVALYQLEGLRHVSPIEAYEGVAVCLRAYLQAQYAVGSLTTDEIIVALAEQLSEKRLRDLQRILGEADLVKFAGLQPEPPRAARLVEVARRWVAVSALEDAAMLLAEDEAAG